MDTDNHFGPKRSTMTSSSIQEKLSLPASCRFARRLLYGSIGFCLLVMLALGMLLCLRSPVPESAAVAVETFSLGEIALWPAGSPRRNPETLHPGVDLRLIPVREIGP